MLSINKVIVAGNLGQDVELKYTKGGTAVANLSVATTEYWKDKNSGQTQSATEWHKVVLWGRQAEIAAEYAGKGSRVYVEGRNQTEKWKDNNNVDHYTTRVIASVFQLVDGKKNGTGSDVPPQIPDQDPGFDSFDDQIPH